MNAGDEVTRLRTVRPAVLPDITVASDLIDHRDQARLVKLLDSGIHGLERTDHRPVMVDHQVDEVTSVFADEVDHDPFVPRSLAMLHRSVKLNDDVAVVTAIA